MLGLEEHSSTRDTANIKETQDTRAARSTCCRQMCHVLKIEDDTENCKLEEMDFAHTDVRNRGRRGVKSEWNLESLTVPLSSPD